MPPWLIILGGIASFVSLVIGGFIAVRKLGPEVNQIQIDSANHLVTMAETNARMSQQQADRLTQQNRDLDNRMTEYARALGEAMSRLEQLEETAKQVARLRSQVDELTGELHTTREELQRAHEENNGLRERLVEAESCVQRLQADQDS